MTLTEAQRKLLNIIASVESGASTPEDAVEQLSQLKAQAAASLLTFRAEYTLTDFQKIGGDVSADPDSSTDPYPEPEPSYQSSY